MAVTSGFFNSLNNDRKYNAKHINQLFEGILNDGVFASIGTSLVVQASAGMTVNVGVGRAWFDKTWTDNDAVLPVVLQPSEMALNRIDAIVLEVDTSDATRNNSIKAIRGVPSSNPVAPVMVNTATVHQHPLCNIAVAAGSTTIVQANITNLVGTASCPFITGILQTMTVEGISALLEEEFNDWFADIQGQLSGDVACNLLNMINNLDNIKLEAADLKNYEYSSYHQFCANVNSDALDAAFGKNNEDVILGLGRQIAMYGWFLGSLKAAFPFTNLLTCSTLQNIVSNLQAKRELILHTGITKLIGSSPYARGVVSDYIDIGGTASASGTVQTQNITITQNDIDVGKIFIGGAKMSRSQGTAGGILKLNNVTVVTLANKTTPTATYDQIVDLLTCNITVPGTYVLSKTYNYGDTYSCTLVGYILKYK